MGAQIHKPLFKSLHILRAKLRLGYAPVVFERPYGGNYHRTGGLYPRQTALYVAEFLRPKIRTESGLGDNIVPQLQRQLCGSYGVTAVGNVCKGTAVHEDRCVFKGLHQIWLQSIL